MDKYFGTNVKHIITSIKAELDAKGKALRAVYWVACGGSEYSVNAGKYIMQSEAKTITTGRFNSNLFVHAAPSLLDETCLVVVCTLKGTAETIEALKTARNAGAYTIALTGDETTPMAKEADVAIPYAGFGTMGDSTALSVKIAAEVLNQFEGYEKYDRIMAVFAHLNDIVAKDRAYWLPQAKKFGKEFKDDKVFYILGCGPLEGTALSMANCHLIEMQTLHAAMIPSGDYFHGPFETTTKDLPMVLIMSNGRTRPLDQRVVNFMEKYAGRYVIIDAKESELYKVADADVAEFFEPVVLWSIERMHVEQLAEVRDHSMDFRNYMWKFEY